MTFDSWPKVKAYVDDATVQGLADAVRTGDAERVRAILQARPELVNFDMAENNEHRALHYAVFARSPELVRILMENGADAHKGIYPHRQATTAYTIAVERGYTEIAAIIEEVEACRRGTSTTAPDELAELISSDRNAEALAMIERQPALATARNTKGWSPLHIAAEEVNELLVETLLTHGADVNARGPGGLTPLDQAAMTESEGEPVVRRLLAHGAEMTVRGAVAIGDLDWLRMSHSTGTLENPPHWRTGGLLTIAVKHERTDVLNLLLDLGYDPNERTRLDDLDEIIYSQGAPLWHCADSGKYALAAALLERGANPNVHVYAAGPPVHRAFYRKDWPMLELLKRYGGVLPPVSIGLFREKELAAQMLTEEATGRKLPDGILEGQNVSEDLLRGAVDSGMQRLCVWPCRALIGPSTTTVGSGF